MTDRHFPQSESLRHFQDYIRAIYGPPGDRHFSTPDLLVQQQRFTMRALKGIRKGDHAKLKLNLLVAFCWGTSIANRFQFDLEDLIWQRFPALCSYCGHSPCSCKKIKPKSRARIRRRDDLRPKKLKDFQEMFASIYPSESRTLEHAGVHLAEEMGEVAEAVHAYLGEHKKKQLEEARVEITDFFSCVFGVANSAKIDIAKELSKMFYKNCHICHCSPCECTVSYINRFHS